MKLRDLPEEDKITFLKEAQQWPKHNQCYVVPSETSNGLHTLCWLTNGFACHFCYRVRPFTAFVSGQIRRKLVKNSPWEGKPGKKRCCIDCAVAKELWRPRTRVAVIEAMSTITLAASVKTDTEVTDKFFCQTCNELKLYEDNNPTCVCADCGAHPRGETVRVSQWLHGYAWFRCKCGHTNLAGQKTVCKFGKHDHPVCGKCGIVADDEGKWWCGMRFCSKEAYELVCSVMEKDYLPVKITLWDEAEEKRARRRTRKVYDMLEGEDDAADCLSLLSL